MSNGAPDKAPRLAALRAAGGLLLLGRFDDASPSVWRAATWWFPLVGLAAGLCWMGIFRATWRICGEVGGVRLLPGLAVLLLECGVLGAAMLGAWVRTVDRLGTGGADPTARGLTNTAVTAPAVALLVVSCYVLLIALPVGQDWWPGQEDWRYYLRRVYPRVIYRPLILAPMWGRWAVLLAASVGRAAGGAPAAVGTLGRVTGPVRLLGQFAAAAALTTVYCASRQQRLVGIIVSLMVLGVCYAWAAATARRLGGQGRDSVLSTGMIGEAGFLVFYLTLVRN